MKKMAKRKIPIISALVVIAISGAVCFIQGSSATLINSDYAAFDTETKIVKAADVIVAGNVLAVKVKDLKVHFTEGKIYTNNEDKERYTVSTIKVTEVLKGNVKVGDVIEVKQLGDGKKVIDQTIIDNGGYFTINSKKILFLESFTKHNVPYSVLNPYQGQYSIEDGVVKSTSKHNKHFKKTAENSATGESSENYTVDEFIGKVKSVE